MSETTPSRINIEVDLNAKKAQKGLKNIEKTLKGFGKIGKTNNKIFSDFLKLAGFAGLTKMTIDAGRFAHSMQMLGVQTGIATDKLSKMSSIWKVWGADSKSLATFSKRLSSDIAMRYTGGQSSFYSAFKKIGVDPLDEKGNIKDLRELFGGVARYVEQQKKSGMKEWAIASILEQVFGMPAEVSSRLMQGEQAWYEFYDEAAKRTADLTKDEIDKLDSGLQGLNEAFENYSIAIKKSAASILGFLQEKGILSGASNFVRENPTTSVLLGATALRYSPSLLKLGWKTTGLLSNPYFLSLFGLYATGMELTGHNILGEKIKKTKPDAVDDLLDFFGNSRKKISNRAKSLPSNLESIRKENYRYGKYREFAKKFESNRSGLDYERIVNAIDENEGLGDFLRAWRTNEEKYNEWDKFFEWYDSSLAERMGDISYEFNQENNIKIDGNTTPETIDYMVDRLGSIKIPNKPVYNAITGVN